MFRKVLLVLGLTVPASAFAIGPGFELHGYYADGSAQAGDASVSADFDGDGYGLRGTFKTGFGWFLAGAYEELSFDEGVDFTDTRVGGGYSFDVTPLASVYGQVDYASLELGTGGTDDTDTGVGAYLGGEVGLLKVIAVHGRAGYLSLEDSDGAEFLVGGTIAFMPMLRGLIEYRYLSLEEGQATLDIDEIRVGLRLSFNA